MRILFFIAACTLLYPVAVAVADTHTDTQEASLVERLGFTAGTRVLIINADDFGMNHSSNEGTYKALKSGAVTSATIMVCCPWFEAAADFARKNPKANLGVHTTLTSEWSHYKWGPVLGCSVVPSLCTEKGYFNEDVFTIYALSNLDEAEKELRAQIDKAIAAGIDITHIDSHMGAMQYDPAFHERYIRIAGYYNLPCRLPGRALLSAFGQERLLDLAKELNVLGPEELFMDDPPSLEATEAFFKERLEKLPEGKVSEMYIHCAVDTPEMSATTGSVKRRVADTDFFSDPETLVWIRGQGIELISYRELRHLQRNGAPMARVEHYGW
jgi:chitin disaccharide deacetylase